MKTLVVAGVAFLLVLWCPARGQTTAATQTDAITAALRGVDPDVDGFKKRQFLAFDAHYEEQRTQRVARLRALAKTVFEREAAGQSIQKAHNILIELHWLITATADFKQVDGRLDDLAQALASPKVTSEGLEEVEGLKLWFFQLDRSYDALERNKAIHFPPELLDRINSPEKLTAYFNSVAVSDIAHDGVDHQEELNEPLADLTRLILRGQPVDYTFDPALKATLIDVILHRLRDPVTGYWGERYRVNGQVQFIPDLSMTFHVINYLNGDVPELEKVVATTLALKDRESPVGWLYQRGQYNHNAMDVTILLRLGWAHASPQQKEQSAVEIQKLIDRCLQESLQKDGSFKHLSVDSSVEEATYFGAAFLSEAGYFDLSKRFWTRREFPEAEEVRTRVIAFIRKNQGNGAAGGGYYKSALEALHFDPGRD